MIKLPAWIKCHDNGTIEVWGKDGNQKYHKYIPANELANMVLGHVTPLKFETPLPMPKGAFYYAEIGGDRYQVALVKPKCRVDYNLSGQVLADIGMPNLLFVFYVEKNRIVATKIACLKTIHPIYNKTELFKYPFSNVNWNGSPCWGSTLMPKINRAVDLDIAVRSFLSMEKNYDLYRQGANADHMEYRELLKYLQGKEFDDNLLVKMKYNFEEFITKNI